MNPASRSFKKLPVLALTLLLCVSPAVLAQDSTDAKRAAMNAAYRQYQELVAQGPQFREQSIAPAREAYELAVEVLGESNPTTAALAINYGNVVTDARTATRVLEHALEMTENLHGEAALELIDPLMALANSATEHDEFGDARRHYTRALEIAQAQEPADPFLEAVIGTQLGITAFRLDRMAEAGDYFRAARELLQPIDNDMARIRLATTNFWIGRYEMTQGNYAGAVAPLQESVAVFDRFPDARPFSVNSHSSLVECYERQGMRDAATAHALAAGAGNTEPLLLYRPAFAGPLWNAGAVNLMFDVSAEGLVENVRVVGDRVNEELGTAAREAVTGLRYAPRFVNGAAASTPDVAFEFRFARPR